MYWYFINHFNKWYKVTSLMGDEMRHFSAVIHIGNIHVGKC